MSEPSTVTDAADPRLSDYTDLTDVELRRRREPAEGLFIAEGEKVIRRALAAGFRMRSMLLTAKWLGVMGDVIAETDAPVHLVEPALAERVTGYHVHRGALASMERKPLPSAAEVLDGARRVAVLEGLVDHTNLGAIFRSAAALGMDAVLLSPDCADPLYRRAVKTSMGAVFSVPYARLDPWPDSLAAVREAGFELLALTPSGAEDFTVAKSHLLDKAALMLGAEGDGLTPKALAAADQRGTHPDGARHRLAERRRRRRDRLLRGEPRLSPAPAKEVEGTGAGRPPVERAS